MFPGLDEEFGEQINYFQTFKPHVHYHVRMKGKHYTAFATPAKTGSSFSQSFDHEPTPQEVMDRFKQDERLQTALAELE
jgi:hypothetical protein